MTESNAHSSGLQDLYPIPKGISLAIETLVSHSYTQQRDHIYTGQLHYTSGQVRGKSRMLVYTQ